MAAVSSSLLVAPAPTTRRSRPAFEKLLIGPAMVFGEMITGGHYLEVLRLGKQMAVGHEAAPSYWRLHTSLVHESGTFWGAFYRGFMPWGLVQCAKGVPVLFVQHESMYQLQAKAGWSSASAERASGFMGGLSQALFVNPFQKVKVTVVACEQMNALSPVQALQTVVRRNGLLSLYDGVVPMMMRRSLDWGIRFGVSAEVKHWMLQQKSPDDQKLTAAENIFCGLVGGAFSASTHPIDNMITNSQKPMPAGKRRDLVAVVQRMYRESGVKAFTRGWGIKVIDNAVSVPMPTRWIVVELCSDFSQSICLACSVVPHGLDVWRREHSLSVDGKHHP